MKFRFQYSSAKFKVCRALVLLCFVSVFNFGCLEHEADFETYIAPRLIFSEPQEILTNTGYLITTYYDFQGRIFFQNSLDSNFWSISYYTGIAADTGIDASSIGWMAPANDSWFVFNSAGELYRSDGVTSGLLMDINGSGNSNPQYIYNFNDKAVFSAGESTNGVEPWVTDGTVAGTNILKDLNSGAGSSSPLSFFDYNNELYFKATDGTKWQLYKSDLTSSGTVATNATAPLSSFSGAMNLGNAISFYPIIYDNKLWFTGNDSSTGNEPWYYDFDTDTSTQVIDLRVGISGGMKVGLVPYQLLSEKLYFVGWNVADKFEIWVHDPDLGTTTQVSSGCKNTGLGSSPTLYGAANGLAFFCKVNGLNGQQLFVSDGTVAGTQRVSIWDAGDTGINVAAGFNYVIEQNGKVLFFSNDATSTGFQLWETDGTVLGTVKVSDHCNSLNTQHRVYPASNHVVYSIDDDCDSVGSSFIYTP